MARAATGLTAAGLVLVLGLAALAWCAYVGIGLLVLCGFVVLGTYAPSMPGLHAVPKIGAPQVSLTARTVEPYRSGALVEIGVNSPTRLDDATANLVVPAGVNLTPSTSSGSPIQEGSLQTTQDEFGPGTHQVYWLHDLDIRAGPRVRHFTMRPQSAGLTTIPARFKLRSEKLYRPIQLDFYVEFPEGDSGKLDQAPPSEPPAGQSSDLRDIRHAISALQSAIDRFEMYKPLSEDWDKDWKDARDKFADRVEWRDAYHATSRAFGVLEAVNEDMRTTAGAHPTDVDGAVAEAADAIALLDELAQKLESPDKPKGGEPYSEMTPYERLKVLHREGQSIVQAAEIAIDSTSIIRGVNDVAAWTLKVARVMKNVAPEFHSEWLETTELERTPRGMRQRLARLEGIMSRLKARDGG